MPPCLEIKHALSGTTQNYHCELLHYAAGFGILRYVVDRTYDIQGFRLAPGDDTIALYWEARSYTLYIWRTRTGGEAHYFNIADSIALSPGEFIWRDLVVDVLVDRRGARVLDEHELPSGIDPVLGRFIFETKEHILAAYPDIIRDASHLIAPFV